ncbi:MAG: hypothetical protein FJX76_01695 [Armatimonadetes bacterium]|nr:hypothetical protein [Armatimonadota bacterium]
MDDVTVYTPGNRFYDGLVAFLAAAASLSSESRPLRLPCRDENNPCLVLDPEEVLAPLRQNLWPEQIAFQRDAGAGEGFFGNPALTRVIESLLRAEFVSFYEAWAAPIVVAHGKNLRQWPPAWAFGRIVRNALAHGGRFEIFSATDVSWRGRRFTDADHGRSFSSEDVRSGEFILLMADMDAALNLNP